MILLYISYKNLASLNLNNASTLYSAIRRNSVTTIPATNLALLITCIFTNHFK